MTFKLVKPTTVPARGQQLLQPVEKLNIAMNLLGRVQGDPLQSAVRVGELIDAGVLQYDPSGALVAGTALGGGARVPLTFKNYLINGDFRWWQRGTTFATSASPRFTADRFAVGTNFNTNSANQQAFPPGQTDVPGNPAYFHRLSLDTVSGNSLAYTVGYQRLENLARFAGKRLTVSWYAKANAAREMSLEHILTYGTGGSATEIINAPKKHSVTTSWQRFTQTFVMPSLAGKVINIGDSSLLMQFWFGAGSDAGFQTRSAGMGNTTGIIDIACMQMEDGDGATDFEFLPPALSLMQCQRYYEKSYNPETALGSALTYAGASTNFLDGLTSMSGRIMRGNSVFKVTKRASPSITVYNPENGVSGTLWDYSGGGQLAVSVNFIGVSGFNVQATQTITTTRVDAAWHWAADSEW